MGIQKPMQTRPTDRMLEDFGMYFEVVVGPTKGPSTAPGQGIVLAIEGNDPWCDLGRDGGWPACSRVIQNTLSGLKPLPPVADGFLMASQHQADGSWGCLILQQQSDFHSLQQPGCERGERRTELANQHIWIGCAFQEFDGFFFRSPRCSGSEDLMRERPRAETW